MNIHGWKFEKKKLIVQKDQEKKWKQKWSWTKEKKNEEKESKSAIWALLCKVSEIDVIWEKNYAPLIFRNYFVPYISFLHS